MKKCLYTLNIGNYLPEISAITLPLMERYAKKIGASFHIIMDRKFPKYPIVYEKFQIFELAQKQENDWNIFFDLDSLLHPDFWDLTVALSKDTTCSGYTSDFTPQRFKPDKYFLRDGRFIGKGNWFGIASNWCLDYWHPLEDLTLDEAVKNITPTQDEVNNGIERAHLIDDYTVSRNIAKYGLKHTLLSEIEKSRGIGSGYVWHTYVKPQGWFNSARPDGQPAFSQEELTNIMKELGKPLDNLTVPEVKLILMKKQLQVWGIR